MVIIVELKEISKDELNVFFKSVNYSLYQTNEYASVMKHQGFNVKILGLEDNGNIIGSCVLLITKKQSFNYAFCPRGFVIDYSNFDSVKNFTIEIKKYCKNNNIVAIKLNPLIVKDDSDEYNLIFNNLIKLGYNHLGYNDFFESFKPRFEARVEINDLSVMFNNIKKEYRTKIRSSIDNSVEIHKGSYDDLKYLYNLTEKKYPRDLLYFQYLYYYFNPNIDLFYAKLNSSKLLSKFRDLYVKQEEKCRMIDSKLLSFNDNRLVSLKMEADNLLGKYRYQLNNASKLMQFYPNGIVIAAGLFIRENNGAYMIMDGYDKKYKSYNAKHLLIWQALNYYKDCKYLCLGGMTSLKEDKYKGLNDFKMNFGSKCIEYIGDLELVCIPSKYFLLKNIRPYEKLIKDHN